MAVSLRFAAFVKPAPTRGRKGYLPHGMPTVFLAGGIRLSSDSESLIPSCAKDKVARNKRQDFFLSSNFFLLTPDFCFFPSHHCPPSTYVFINNLMVKLDCSSSASILKLSTVTILGISSILSMYSPNGRNLACIVI